MKKLTSKMKHVVVLMLLAMFWTGASFGQIQLLKYDFATPTTSIDYTVAGKIAAAGTAASGFGSPTDFTLGNGANTKTGGTTSYLAMQGTASTNADATTTVSYIQFTVTAPTNQFFNSSYDLNVAISSSRSSSGSSNYAVYYSYGTSAASSPLTTPAKTAAYNSGSNTITGVSSSSYTTGTIGIPKPTNNTSNVLTIQIRTYGAGTTGNWRIGTITVNSLATTLANATVSSSAAAPSLTAATATVDNNFDVTFTDDATWRGAITTVKYGTSTLTASTDYTLASGKITLKPSATNGLGVAGSQTLTISATNYADATVSQAIGAGVASNIVVSTQPTAPSSNGAALAQQPKVTIQDQYGNTSTGSSATVTASATSSAWTIGGTLGVAASSGIVNYSGLTASYAGTLSTASITFTFTNAASVTKTVTSNTFTIPSPAPTLTPSSTTVTGVAGFVGAGASAATQLSVIGAYLTGYAPTGTYITIDASGTNDFEVSTTSSTQGFAQTASIQYTAASLASSNFWIRIKAGSTASTATLNPEIVTVYGGGVAVGSAAQISVSGTVTVTSSVTITDNNTPAYTLNFGQGMVNNVLQSFKIKETAGIATSFNSFSATLAGTFTSNDIAAFKLWSYTSDSTATGWGERTLVSTGTLSGSTVTFTGFTSSIAASGSMYYWLTFDASNTSPYPTLGVTISSPSISISSPTSSISSAFGFSNSAIVTSAAINASATFTAAVNLVSFDFQQVTGTTGAPLFELNNPTGGIYPRVQYTSTSTVNGIPSGYVYNIRTSSISGVTLDTLYASSYMTPSASSNPAWSSGFAYFTGDSSSTGSKSTQSTVGSGLSYNQGGGPYMRYQPYGFFSGNVDSRSPVGMNYPDITKTENYFQTSVVLPAGKVFDANTLNLLLSFYGTNTSNLKGYQVYYKYSTSTAGIPTDTISGNLNSALGYGAASNGGTLNGIDLYPSTFNSTIAGMQSYTTNANSANSVDYVLNAGLATHGLSYVGNTTIPAPPSYNYTVLTIQVRILADNGSGNLRLGKLQLTSKTATPVIAPPSVTSISPSSAYAGASFASVTVTGNYFTQGVTSANYTYTSGGSISSYTSNPTVTVNSATSATVSLGSSDLANNGLYSLTLVNSGNTTSSVAKTFSVLAIPSISIADNSTPSTVTTANTGTTNNILQAFTITEGGNSSTVLNTIVASLTGSYTTGDITTNGFKLWASSSSNFATVTSGTPLASVSSATGHGESITFSSLNYNIPKSGVIYLWITVNISGTGTTGHTVIPSALSTSAFTFSVGTVSGSVNAGGGYNVNNTSSALIDDIATQPSLPITQNTTKNVLVGFTFTPTGGTANFSSLTVTSTGTATSTDLQNISIYKDVNANGVYDAGTDILVSSGTTTYAASMTFVINSSENSIASGTTRQYLITADVADVATSTIGHTVKLSIGAGAFSSGLSVDNSQLNSQNFLTIAAPTPSTTIATVSGSTTSISSLVNTQAAADALSPNLSFKITDDGAAHVDNQPTQFTSIAFTATTTTAVTDWSQVLAGAELSDGTNTTTTATIGTNSITFSGLSSASGFMGYIGSQANKTYTLRVWLKSSLSAGLQTTIANQVLALGIATTGITTLSNAVCSQIAASQSLSTSNTITVTATALAFVTQPTASVANITMASVSVQAIDANGNRDLTYSPNISVASTNLSGTPVSVSAVNGLATFNTLTITQAGTSYSLTAASASLPQVTSSSFVVTAGVTNLYSNAATLTWDAVTANKWSISTNGANPTYSWVNGVTANFVTTTSAITVSSTNSPSANGLYFGVTGCSLATGTGVLTLTGTSPTVTFNTASTSNTFALNSPIAATGNVIFQTNSSNFNATLNVASVGQYSGAVTIAPGITSVKITTSNPFGSSAATTLYLNPPKTNPLIFTQSGSGFTVPNNIVIGSGAQIGIGASSSGNTLTYSGTITSNGSVNQICFGNSSGFTSAGAPNTGGAGTTIIKQPMTYQGTTYMNGSASQVLLQSGVDNTLPTSTDVLYYATSSNAQKFDLSGNNQKVASISTTDGTNSPTRVTTTLTGGGFINSSTTTSTLTLEAASLTGGAYGVTTGYNIDRSALNYSGIIGGTATNNNNINLVLSSLNNPKYKVTFYNANTYTGTTTVSGGTLVLNHTGGNTIPVTNSVTINGGTLEISTNQTLASLTLNSGTLIIDPGATLTLGAFTYTAGTITNNGTLNLNYTPIALNYTSILGGTLQLGAASATISNSLDVTNLTVSNGATISNTLNIHGILTVSAGTLALGTGKVTLKSTSITNSATVGQVSGTITGTATVERYIPMGYRGYRDMAPEVYGAGSIFKNWQENGAVSGNVPSGYDATKGIFITGSSATAATSGFPGIPASAASPNPAPGSNSNYLDYSPNGISSAFIFGNGAGQYNYTGFGTGTNYAASAITNTNTVTLDPFVGYRVMIRGARDFNLFSTPIVKYQGGLIMNSATTLRATGGLVYNNVTYSTTGVTGTASNGGASNTSGSISSANRLNPNVAGWSMVANPYVCPVDWKLLYANSTTSSIQQTYFHFDPTFGENGKWVGYNAISGSPYNTTYDKQGQYIQPGQAFLIQNNTSSVATAPSLNFTEATKAASPSTHLAAVFGVTNQLSKIYVSLFGRDANSYTIRDGAAVAFRSDFGNTAYGPQDAVKLSNASDNLYISDKSKSLSIDGRLPATANDVISLAISKPSTTSYQLIVDATDYIDNGFAPSLYDSYKNTTTAIAGVDSLTFTIDTAVAATYANRFSIVFSPTALPVNSIVASASLNNKIATINWSTVGEKNVSRYEVEKSADAKTFTKIGQATAKNTATANYSTTENNVTATTYYRIKAVSTSGSISYSNVAKVQLTVNSNQFAVYPNPLVGKTLNIQVANVSAGKYLVSIYNVLGEKVSEQSINHEGGSASHAITISNTLARGTYSVTVREAKNNQQVYQTNLSVQP